MSGEDTRQERGLNLRVVRKNNDWNKIVELTKTKFSVAA